jgi:hypothetical protein
MVTIWGLIVIHSLIAIIWGLIVYLRPHRAAAKF